MSSSEEERLAAEAAAEREETLRRIEEINIRDQERAKKTLESARDHAASLEYQKDILEQQLETETNRAVKRERMRQIRDQELEIELQQFEVEKKQIELARENGEINEEDARAKIAQLQAQKELVKEKKKELEQARQAVKGAQDMVLNLGKAALSSSKLGTAIGAGIGGMVKMGKAAHKLNLALKAGAISAAALTAALGLGLIMIAVGVIAKLIETVFLLSVKTRDATVAFQRATGATAEFGEQVADAEYELRGIGVTMEKANKAQLELYKSTTDYTMASKQQRQQLLETTAMLGEFGVSFTDAAAVAQIGTKGLGMSIGETDDLLRRTAAHAEAIGVPMDKLVGDFAKMGGTIEKFGQEGERVFQRLAMVSKVTGMEMSRIIDITSKFDTFEGAAKQAGALNAALGGNFVNAMDLMMQTDPVDRFQMIQDAISQSGQSFDEMSYYQKEFYKNSLGLKDVGELAALMSGDFEHLDATMNMTSADFEKQRKKAGEWQSTMDVLKNTLSTMAPMFKDLSVIVQRMVEEFRAGEGPLKDIGKAFEKIMTKDLEGYFRQMPRIIGDFVKFLEGIPAMMDKIILAGKVLAGVLAVIGAVILIVTLPGWALVAVFAAIAAGVIWLMSIFKKKNSWSFLDMFEEGKLAESFSIVTDMIDGMMESFKAFGKKITEMAHSIWEAFDMSAAVERVGQFWDSIKGKFKEGFNDIKDFLGISSPAKALQELGEFSGQGYELGMVHSLQEAEPKIRKQLTNTQVGAVKAANQETQENLMPATDMGRGADPLAAGAAQFVKLMTDPVARIAAALDTDSPGTTNQEPIKTQVTIPVQIGKQAFGEIVTEIVDGRIGTLSYKGALGIGS